MHECRDCNRALNLNNKCSMCKKPFRCHGHEIIIRDRGYLSEMAYSSVCPSCTAKILGTIISECERSEADISCLIDQSENGNGELS